MRLCILTGAWHSLLLMLAAMVVASAAPLSSPLALSTDSIGVELQQSFIAAPGSQNTIADGFVAYRKQFQLTTSPASAKLYIFADARYILWLNGQPIHRGPNRFETRGPQYDTVEIGSALSVGTNTIAVVVMGNVSRNGRVMYHAPGLTLRVDVGGSSVVKTDTTWKCSNQTRYRPALVTWPDIIDRIDSRVENGDWTQPIYNDSAWNPTVSISGDSWGPLAARRIPLLRDTQVNYSFNSGGNLPITLTSNQQLNFSLNDGRMVQAYTIIEIEADANTQLTFNYAGGITYHAKAGRQTYISSDSYAFSGGSITVDSGRATILSLKFMERLYPFDVAGSFISSDVLLNRLWAVCARSCQLFSEDAYVDCADRERVEWMDCDPPAFDITRTALSSTDANGQIRYADARLLGEMVRRTALTVHSEGWVKAHTCSDRVSVHEKMEDRACDWVEGARRYYDSTGDTELIEEIWPVIVTQMNYFLARRSVRGLVRAREWVVWGNPIGYFTCEGAGLNAFVYKALVDASHLGSAIGQTAQATTFNQAATNLANAMNTVLWDEASGNYFSAYYSSADQNAPENMGSSTPRNHQWPEWFDPSTPINGALSTPLAIVNEKIAPSMFSALWMLDRGVVPPTRKSRVTQNLLLNRNQASNLMTFYYFFHQLYAQHSTEYDTEVLHILRTKWAGMAYSSTQTSWEDFNVGSKAHIYGMFPGYFLSSYVLGVRVDGPLSNNKLRIEPRLGDLEFVQGNVVTELGIVPVALKKIAGGMELKCTVPQGKTADLRLFRSESSLLPKLMLNGQPIDNVITDGRYVVVPVSAGNYTLTVTSELTWRGDSTSNAWNSTAENWRDSANTSSRFIAGASVLFNDIGSNAPFIALAGTHLPSTVTINSVKNYTFSGSGSLAGSMSLTKAGAGTLTLTNHNFYSGGTAINGGTLAISSSDRIGSGPISFGGGRLAVTTDAVLTNSFRIIGANSVQLDTQGHTVSHHSNVTPLAGATGGFSKFGAGTSIFRGNYTYTGATIINEGTLKLGLRNSVPPVAGLLYQLDASAVSSLTLSGNKVTSWKNADGGTVDFVQAASIRQPTLIANTINGLPIVRFSGGQQLVFPSASSPREVVVVTTVKGGADGNIGGILGANDSYNAFAGLRLNSLPNGWATDSAKTDINGVESFTSGVSPYAAYTPDLPHIVHRYQTGWDSWTATGLGQYFTGGDSRFYHGDIAEMLVYGETLTAADRVVLKNYLAAKWLGAVSATAVTTLPSTTSVTLAAAGAKWDLNGAMQSIMSLSGVAGTSVLLGNGSLKVGNETDTEFAGSLSGSGAFEKTGTGTLTLSGSNSITGPIKVSQGTLRILGPITSPLTILPGAILDLQGGTATIQGTITNNGVLRILGGASIISTGSFVNNGLLDIMTSSQTLPTNFINNGTVLDQSLVKVKSIQILENILSLSITSYRGHTYRLQTSETLGAGLWANIGVAQIGTGENLSFIQSMVTTGPRRFYRIAVFP